MVKRNNYAALGILSFIVFVILTLVVEQNLFSHIDYATTVKIQEKVPDFVTPFFSLFSPLGSSEIASLALLLILGILMKANRILVLTFYALTIAIELLGKNIIVHSGPPIVFLKTQHIINFPSDYIPREFFSYPSGHSARTAFVSCLLILIILISKKLSQTQKILLCISVLLFDFIMFFSRVYLGEHWTSDVLGGAILGFSMLLISTIFIARKPGQVK